MQIKYINIDEIKPYAKNPRKINAKAIEVVAKSIVEFGFKNPVIVDKNNVVVCGHTRMLAAKELNIKEIPTIKADDLTDEQIKAFRLIDNKTSEFSEWDYEILINDFSVDFLKEIDFLDSELAFGLSDDEVSIIDTNEILTEERLTIVCADHNQLLNLYTILEIKNQIKKIKFDFFIRKINKWRMRENSNN